MKAPAKREKYSGMYVSVSCLYALQVPYPTTKRYHETDHDTLSLLADFYGVSSITSLAVWISNTRYSILNRPIYAITLLAGSVAF